MKKRAASLAIVVGLGILLSGCSMRVSGFVTDAETDEPVPTAGVMIGVHYAHVDPAGYYSIKTRQHTKDKLEVVAKGYEKVSLSVDSSKTRYPKVNVALTPLKPGAAPSARPAAKPAQGGSGARTAP